MTSLTPDLDTGLRLLDLLEWRGGGLKGKHLTAEHKKNISDALKGRGGLKTTSPGTPFHGKVANKHNPTGPELAKDAGGRSIRAGHLVNIHGTDHVITGLNKKGELRALRLDNYSDVDTVPQSFLAYARVKGPSGVLTRAHPGEVGVPLSKNDLGVRGLDSSSPLATTALHKATNDWVGGLNPKEVAAVKAYTSEKADSYKSVNPHLRHGDPASKKTADMVTHLDSALARSRTPAALTVYRTVDAHGYDPKNLPAGTRIHDKGYGSTSVAKYGSFEKVGDVSMVIQVPKGSRGAYVRGISSRVSEDEFLLPRGHTLEVISSDGKTIHARLVDDGSGKTGGPRTKTKTKLTEAIRRNRRPSKKFSVSVSDWTLTPPG